MARKRKIDLNVLNVTTIVHSPERYSRLIRECHSQLLNVRYRGNSHAMIGALSETKIDGKRMLVGKIYVFVNIDPNTTRWLNVKTREQASDVEMQAIEVPEHLKANFEDFYFVFDPDVHRLAFDARLGPTNGKKIFEELLNRKELSEFGKVTVTLVQATDALEKIFELSELRSLRIFLTVPNPDDLEGVEEEVRERLARLHAESMDLKFTARIGESLKPDKETKGYAEVALSNGYVEARGKTREGRVITESTKNHPLLHLYEYTDEDERPFGEVFIEAARAVLARRVMRRGRKG